MAKFKKGDRVTVHYPPGVLARMSLDQRNCMTGLMACPPGLLSVLRVQEREDDEGTTFFYYELVQKAAHRGGCREFPERGFPYVIPEIRLSPYVPKVNEVVLEVCGE